MIGRPLPLAGFMMIMSLLGGCVSGPDDVLTVPPADPYHTKIAEAWVEFELEHYHAAINLFVEASEIDIISSDAYLGLGWCYAMLDKMEDSLSNLEVAVARDPKSPDAYAARAFVYLAQDEYNLAIGAANKAVAFGGEEYVFSQVPDVCARNLHVLMSECYYALGQYEDAQAQIDILDPDNDLDRNSRAYKQDLLLEIETLNSPGPVLDRLMN